MRLRAELLTETWGDRSDQGDVQLAVVIPVWRGRFLAAALDSLRAQTDRRFRVYICDDCSPDDVRSIIEQNGIGLDIVYHRFQSNLGGSDLVKQWERCLSRVNHENWFWLFADDDEAMPETVASFYRMRKQQPNARLFCLGVQVIDELGEVLRNAVDPPAEESADALLGAFLARQGREGRGADHLFSRSLHEECGGFVWTPQAMYADLASWVVFTAAAGTKYKLSEGGLRWRQHSDCVSQGKWNGSRGVFLDALMIFTEWVDGFVAEYPRDRRRQLSRDMFRHYRGDIRSLPSLPVKGEGVKIFKQLWSLPHVGGRFRAVSAWVTWIRIESRNWPLISAWCGWKYRRDQLSTRRWRPFETKNK